VKVVMTIDQLREHRRQLAALRRLLTDLTAQGFDPPGSHVARLAELAGMTAVLTVPCLACRRPYQLSADVGDPVGNEPLGVLCGECDAEAFDDFLAEMEAAR
jgi:hypothetical protein